MNHNSSVIRTGLVVGAWLLAAASLAAPPRPATPTGPVMLDPDQSLRLKPDAAHLEGVVSIDYSCDHHDGLDGCHRTVRLTEPSGASHVLSLPKDLAASLPMDKDLQGEYVRVSKVREEAGKLEIDSISRVPEQFRPKNFVREFRPASTGASLFDPRLGAKPYVVILAKYAGTTTEPHTRAYYDQLFGTASPGLQHWFSTVSYGRMTIAGTVIVGWITLPKAQADYIGANNITDMGMIMKDACDLVDSQVDFSQFYGIDIMVNGSIGNAGGIGGGVVMTRDGQNRFWGGTVNSPAHTQSLLTHEMGHSLGLGHAGNQYGDQYGSPFDTMGRGYTSAYGIGYHAAYRWMLDWIPAANEEVVWPGSTRLIKLERRADPVDTAAKRLIRVYLPGWASRYVTLETVKGGQYEPTQTGVIISEIDEHRTGDWHGSDPLRVIDYNNNNNLSDAGTLLQPGQTYSNPTWGLTVTVTGSGATSYNVQVTVSAAIPLASTVKSNGDSGAFTVREAITFANRHPGQTIKFNLTAAQLSSGVARFYPKSWLPDITGANTTVDGESQTTFGGNTNANGPEVCLDGTLAGDYITGLVSRSANTTFRGLNICNYKGHGILIDGVAATDAKVTGCYIGCDPTGMLQAKNGWDGININNGAKGAVIGTPASGNLLSGNVYRGVGAWTPGSDNTVIENNIIGLNRTGYGSLSGPQQIGISIVDGPKNTLIRGNTIGNHTYSGIEVFGPNTTDTVIKGNRIGTLLNGSNKAGNKAHGILVTARTTDTLGPKNTVIGGAATADRNVFGGNSFASLWVSHTGTSGVRILGNYFGVGANGSANVGGAGEGIVCREASDVIIGGTAAGEGNLVGFNNASGIWLSDNNIQVLGNKIGFTAAGLAAQNNGTGIAVNECTGAKIGGTATGAGNLVGNTLHNGIGLWNGDNAIVQGNVIGLDSSMRAANIGYDGVVLASGTTGAQIGGGTAAAKNVIASALKGVSIWNTATKNNLVQGNWIGFTQDGLQARAIRESGVVLADLTSANTIGGATAALGNAIGSCTNEGIVAFGATSNTIQNNLIGISTKGFLSGVTSGIGFGENSNSNIVKANIIPKAINSGIWTWKASSNKFQGNLIGFMPDGVTNGLIGDRGILINELSNNNEVGGNGAGLGNRIGNAKSGVAIFNCAGTKLYGNTIGLNANNAAGSITEDGIGIYNGSTLTVAGASGAGANIISNCLNGVGIWGDTTLKNTIRFNQIFGNRTLGINLLKNDSAGGVTLNDSLDADTGPNGLQNFPVVSSLTGGTAAGSFSSKASSTYTIDFYSSTAAGVSGYGEGKTYLGSLTVTTNASGTATFSKSLSVAVGAWVTATATDSTGSTSEFSLAVQRAS